MAIDFSYQLPVATDRDRVRFFIGDTNSARPLLDDAEIAYALSLASNNILRSAAYACDAIAAKLIRESAVSVQGITLTRSLSAEGYKKLATEYRARSKSFGPNAGFWILKDPAEKAAYLADSGLIPPAIRREMHDNKREHSGSLGLPSVFDYLG